MDERGWHDEAQNFQIIIRKIELDLKRFGTKNTSDNKFSGSYSRFLFLIPSNSSPPKTILITFSMLIKTQNF